MSVLQKLGSSEKGSDAAKNKVVVVAVKASMKEISRTALVWALTHVVQPGDCIILLVVVPSITPGKKLWGFPRFNADCASGQKWAQSGTEQKFDLTDSCSQMMLDLHHVYDPNKINIKIKVVSGSPCGAVATESKRAHANWVVMERQLKQEEKCCIEELHCNIVVMKGSQPKVLRLNLAGSPKSEPEESFSSDPIDSIRGPVVTPNSSPDIGTPFTATEAGASSVSSSEPGMSPFFICDEKGNPKKEESLGTTESRNLDNICSDSDSESMSTPSTSASFQPWVAEILGTNHTLLKHSDERSQRLKDHIHFSTANTLVEKFTRLDYKSGSGRLNPREDLDFSGNVRETVSLSRSAPAGPPPLCSICQHKAPVFGKPPKWFSYAELELATSGFSQANFLAEGGFGSVHRGVLPDGQPVAVKQHKLASSQGDLEFCSEVEVLSCAQHRNVVMLIGFCVENSRRLLVYEYICNGSLDYHLYGRNQPPLQWVARQKVAVGAARGLRYLHEECRVGCIVHRDMRPNNILITHDFASLVGDFGLARWQPDGNMGVETRVIGTFGYLAPEYAQSGQITEKADVYSFGVVLVELITGRKAVDIHRPRGQQCLTEWARSLLEEYAIHELIDPSLGNHYSEQEVLCMIHAASLCIRRDPHSRPRMSQVLRILEGDTMINSSYTSTPGNDSCSSRSGRWCTEQQPQQQQRFQRYGSPIFSEAKEFQTGKLSQEALRANFRDRAKALRTSRENML